MKCPNCGHDGSGAFCSECGTPLKGARCSNCNAPLATGAAYCNNCGTRVKEKDSKLPWYVAGIALLALLGALLIPGLRRPDADAQQADASGAPVAEAEVPQGDAAQGGAPGQPPPLTGTPREQADRLFNRIMSTRESGDTARAKFFLPMGVAAYQQAGDLDEDGLYHLSLLQTFKGDAADARKSAEQALARAPNHLLALAAAAEAAAAGSDKAAARKYYEKFLSVYDAEKGKPLPEYQDHAQILPEYQAEARKYVGKP
jgi:hypothetical protein